MKSNYRGLHKRCENQVSSQNVTLLADVLMKDNTKKSISIGKSNTYVNIDKHTVLLRARLATQSFLPIDD